MLKYNKKSKFKSQKWNLEFRIWNLELKTLMSLRASFKASEAIS